MLPSTRLPTVALNCMTRSMNNNMMLHRRCKQGTSWAVHMDVSPHTCCTVSRAPNQITEEGYHAVGTLPLYVSFFDSRGVSGDLHVQFQLGELCADRLHVPHVPVFGVCQTLSTVREVWSRCFFFPAGTPVLFANVLLLDNDLRWQRHCYTTLSLARRAGECAGEFLHK